MGFLQNFEKTLADQCFQNEPPFCSAACPFHLDINDLIHKWRKGRFNAAYRTFQNTVGFPGIVAALCPHPCEKACLRCRSEQPGDGAVSLHLLEQATLAYAKRKKPNAYNMPLKDKKIAVIGSGLSGRGQRCPDQQRGQGGNQTFHANSSLQVEVLTAHPVRAFFMPGSAWPRA